MTIVIIAEKPSVANDLAGVLNVKDKKESHWHSENLIITWAVGHLLELKSPDEYNSDLKNWRKSLDSLPYVPESFDFKPKQYTKKQLNGILKILKDKSVTEVVNACDAAREGELIFRSIIQIHISLLIRNLRLTRIVSVKCINKKKLEYVGYKYFSIFNFK